MPKERVVETRKGQLQLILEEPKEEIGKITETIEVPARLKPEQITKRITEKELETKKLLNQIEDWKKKGYDTTILELEIKALEDKELRKQIGRLKEWKSKGYNTPVLEEKIKSIYGDGKKSSDVTHLENKIQEWKKMGYNTLLLEEKLKRLKNK